jgi:hypothetical protein
VRGYTPGPWQATKNGRAGNTYYIWRADPGRNPSNRGYVCISPHVHGYANARLIKAAPSMYEALKDVTVSLIAAVSLLERGGKKAAGSDKMFSIMLDDYRKSIEAGRAALSLGECRTTHEQVRANKE